MHQPLAVVRGHAHDFGRAKGLPVELDGVNRAFDTEMRDEWGQLVGHAKLLGYNFD